MKGPVRQFHGKHVAARLVAVSSAWKFPVGHG